MSALATIGDPVRGSLAQELNKARARIEMLEANAEHLMDEREELLAENATLRAAPAERLGTAIGLSFLTGMAAMAVIGALVMWWTA